MKKLKMALAVAAFSGIATAHAEINFRGFGSIVAGVATGVDEEQAVLGYDDNINFKQDSLLALQMDADMGDGLSATMQLMSRGENNFEPDVEWAYLTYQINDEFQLSAGRIRAPFYRYSDFLDVRYAYNWVSAPARVYAFDFPGYDGLSLLHTTTLGPVDSSLQVVVGELDDFAGSVPITLENLFGVSWVGSWEWITGRASFIRSKASIDLPDADEAVAGFSAVGVNFLAPAAAGLGALSDAYAMADPQLSGRLGNYATAYGNAADIFATSSSNFLIDEDYGTYFALGLGVDYESFIMDAEWITYEVEDSIIPETNAYYVTLGWRFGPTTVYGTYSREKGETLASAISVYPSLTPTASALAAETIAGADPDDIAGLVAAGFGADMAVQGLAENKIDIVNTHIGVRWDFHPSAAFKFSYEKENNKESDVDGGLVRAAVDFVF